MFRNSLKAPVLTLALIALIAFACIQTASAQAAGTITFSVTPTTAVATATPRATWSTSPVATSCKGSWTANTLTGSGSSVALPTITASTDYTLTCTWPGSAGTATINWTAPSTNTDNSPITDLAGFRVAYGTSAANLSQSVSISGATAANQTISSLTPGTTYFFGVFAVNAKGIESDVSNIATKLIAGGTPPTASKTVSVNIDKKPGSPSNTTAIETTAYLVVPNLQKFTFDRGARFGTVPIGATCDPKRKTSDGLYTVISPRTQVSPRAPTGSAIVARCG